jgi:hypothetical protein
MRDKVWSLLSDCKFKSFYMGFMIFKFQKRDLIINIFLAVAASGSIAAWAIWNVYPMLWGAIIATSQIVTTIKPYFPYYKYVKELNEKLVRINYLNIELEKLWYKMQEEKITLDDASEQYFILQKELTDILNFSDDSVYDVNNNAKKKAETEMKIFYKSQYNIYQ